MLIDWFTVFAQVINFLILVFLLKRFLYGPIVKAMEKREQRIAQRMQDAENIRAENSRQAQALARTQEELSRERESILEEARHQASAWLDEALERARNEVDEQRLLWLDNLKAEQNAFLTKLKLRLGKQVMRVAGKVLKDLADCRLENQLVHKFIVEVKKDLKNETTDKKKMTDNYYVFSGFPLDNDIQEKLRQTLHEIYNSKEITFSLDDKLGLGIRLVGGDRKVEWNLNRYMRELEEDIINNLRPALDRENT